MDTPNSALNDIAMCMDCQNLQNALENASRQLDGASVALEYKRKRTGPLDVRADVKGVAVMRQDCRVMLNKLKEHRLRAGH